MNPHFDHTVEKRTTLSVSFLECMLLYCLLFKIHKLVFHFFVIKNLVFHFLVTNYKISPPKKKLNMHPILEFNILELCSKNLKHVLVIS